MLVGDRHAELPKAMREIGGAVERIDNPSMLTPPRVRTALFGEDRVVREGAAGVRITARSDSWSASVTRSIALVLRVTLMRLKRRRWIRPAARAAPSATCSSLGDVGTGFVRIADGRYLTGAALSNLRQVRFGSPSRLF
jgi:hypothetical protein